MMYAVVRRSFTGVLLVVSTMWLLEDGILCLPSIEKCDYEDAIIRHTPISVHDKRVHIERIGVFSTLVDALRLYRMHNKDCPSFTCDIDMEPTPEHRPQRLIKSTKSDDYIYSVPEEDSAAVSPTSMPRSPPQTSRDREKSARLPNVGNWLIAQKLMAISDSIIQLHHTSDTLNREVEKRTEMGAKIDSFVKDVKAHMQHCMGNTQGPPKQLLYLPLKSVDDLNELEKQLKHSEKHRNILQQTGVTLTSTISRMLATLFTPSLAKVINFSGKNKPCAFRDCRARAVIQDALSSIHQFKDVQNDMTLKRIKMWFH